MEERGNARGWLQKVMLLVAGWGALLTPPAAWAEEVWVGGLPEVTVTATRSTQSLARVPGNVTIIDRQQIEELKPQNVSELLKGVPGVMVQDLNGTGTQASVDMRGFGATAGSHVLVTVDGRRQNLLDQNYVDFTTIPVDNIERIEVLHGPAGVLYGDTAVGGVINIITRDGKGQPSGRIESRYGSNDLWGARGLFQGQADRLSYLVTARQDSTDGYRDNSETRLRAATFKTRYQASDTLGVLLDGEDGRSNFSLPGSLTKQQFDQDPKASYVQNKWYERQNSGLRGQVDKDWNAGGRLKVDLSWRQWRSDSVYYTYLQSQAENWGVQPKYVLDFGLLGLDSRLTAGVDAFFWQGSYDFSQVGGAHVIRDDFHLASMAAYLLEELSLTDKLTLEVGGRQQRHQYEFDAQPDGGVSSGKDLDDDAQAWSTGLTWNPVKEVKVFGRLGQSFRFPLVDEYVGTYSGTFTELKPERAFSYDLGGQWSFVPGGQVSLTAYLMQVRDEIAYDEITYQNRNLDETQHQGLEAAVKVPLGKKVSVFGSLTWQQARFAAGVNDGNEVPLVPSYLAAVGASWRPLEGLSLGLRVRQVGPRWPGNDFANQQEKLDSFQTVDLNLNYVWGRWDFFMCATNLFSERYSSLAYYSSWSGDTSYNPEPEAQVWGGVGLSF